LRERHTHDGFSGTLNLDQEIEKVALGGFDLPSNN